jgi:phosphate uptake regulator
MSGAHMPGYLERHAILAARHLEKVADHARELGGDTFILRTSNGMQVTAQVAPHFKLAGKEAFAVQYMFLKLTDDDEDPMRAEDFMEMVEDMSNGEEKQKEGPEKEGGAKTEGWPTSGS